ncbi:CMD domain protein [Pseudoclavibacter chungangensis]|uniref:CMD domain protein n=1 Tax=Pseudoclavibacter chungangensis TaxID=587635 RepID=UPI00184CDDEA|nr:CMD domain protein [Pseudoclavibacter chungangensis]NYJ68051.1 CMD domain protein [Pseudoclavibacter chungangensis]
MSDDVIDEVLAILPGDPLDAIRAARPAARENAQRSYEALFEPVDASEASLAERALVAQFVTGVSREPLLTDWYRAAAVDAGAESQAEVVDALVATSATTGPFGAYAEVGLAEESTDGLRLTIDAATRQLLGARLASAIEHAHLLVFRPREASAAALDRLLDAGWSTTGIVTISQLIAFVSFQLRLVIGLGALQADLVESGATAPTGTATPRSDS